ncbi:CTP synthase [Lacrimispora sp. 210928-DFI.3.58]|uniref:CTP synthase n=1 Tax=Lacrimispora sp. 210928-DFI.3.58 TaxID=2883214 RepID=UPI001D06F3F0|nr:CTP synthase [Lacrimispora sp. 210928-DFI.3.58]MCB7318665.1 CTP synthase [Lacrimispora sp. 210928-DFI.3.58]
MPVKYVFVTGGVVSGLGKGITAASLGRLLKARGYKVTMQKFDPYINIDPGTMNPVQHGEVFVTDDGAETDLDLGHYERFIDESLTKNSNVTTGKVYWSVLQKERRGDFGGGTVQVIPHITNEIKSRFHRNYNDNETEIAIIEVGGTVGDIESQPFLEAIRQFQREVGPGNTCLIHVTLIPYLKASGELKTKPTQASVKDLQGMGIQPDILVCRSEHPLDDGIKNKIALFCNVPKSHVLQNLDVEVLYEVPLVMEEEHLAQVACECLDLPCPEPDLADWQAMINAWKHPDKDVTVALVGKYTQLHDAYISVVEALKHGGVANHAQVHIKWVDSETVTSENVGDILGDVKGILVPGGFGDRGIDGKIYAIRYAREHGVPFLGLCLGMQLSIVEFARNVIGWSDAHSVELNPSTTHPVIHLMPEQDGIEDIGGTLRLGSYPCVLDKASKAYGLYGQETIHERHRHRYEVNNDYRKALTEHGMMLSGLSPDNRIVEMIELPEHPWFVATQAHPELKSRPNRPHPLFRGFIEAALKNE